MKPAADRILVRELKLTETRGGIVIPETSVENKAKNLAQRCEVIAIGPGAIHAQDGHEPRRLTVQEITGFPLAVGSVVYCHRFIGDYRWQDSSGAYQEAKVVGAAEILGVEAD